MVSDPRLFLSGSGSQFICAVRADFVIEFRIGMIRNIFLYRYPTALLILYFFTICTYGQNRANRIYKAFFKRPEASVQHLQQLDGQNRIFYDFLAQVPLIDAKGPGILSGNDTGRSYQIIDQSHLTKIA